MNKNEHDLYIYLTTIPEDEFDYWLETATDEQIDIADRLFDEAKLEKSDFVEDLSVANDILKQFTLKG